MLQKIITVICTSPKTFLLHLPKDLQMLLRPLCTLPKVITIILVMKRKMVRSWSSLGEVYRIFTCGATSAPEPLTYNEMYERCEQYCQKCCSWPTAPSPVHSQDDFNHPSHWSGAAFELSDTSSIHSAMLPISILRTPSQTTQVMPATLCMFHMVFHLLSFFISYCL